MPLLVTKNECAKNKKQQKLLHTLNSIVSVTQKPTNIKTTTSSSMEERCWLSSIIVIVVIVSIVGLLIDYSS